MSKTSDARYGRGGGRYVPWDDAPAPPPCEVCHLPVHAATDDEAPIHRACRPDADIPGQGDLFGGDAA